MMELVDTSPAIHVAAAEYHRLLGYPPGRELSERALELEAETRAWYAAHGRPWLYARESADLKMSGAAMEIEGVPFSVQPFAPAEGAILVAVGAGPELEEQAQHLWTEGKPDEYFFLQVFGAAVVEHLMALAGRRLCEWAENRQLAVLPHRSPGYPGWDIADQASLLQLIRPHLPYPLEVLESGALRPTKSQLAVFGLTAALNDTRRLTGRAPCESCTLPACQFRRIPPKYNVRLKALERWAAERLTLQHHTDGSIDATFRYDGTTCSNMGRPLAFQYEVKLGPPELGYPIQHQSCQPAPDDTGHMFMCGYIKSQGALMDAIAGEKPLAGESLDAVLAWQRPLSPAGCYCDESSRQHKWGLVLETIHYALAKMQ